MTDAAPPDAASREQSGALDDVEVRALGCLVEKQLTTPQYYPLTINALVNACNQTSNRAPIMHVTEPTVHTALRSLRDRGFVRAVHNPGDRVTKYRHVLDEALELRGDEIALLAVLFLRGPQTSGELRGRTERMAEIATVEAAESILDGLGRRATPLVTKLERQPGQKEQRYAHLLAGEPDAGAAMASDAPVTGASAPRPDRVAELAAEVAALREEVAALRETVVALRTRVPGTSEDQLAGS